jgi:DNA-directed RNA polymerase specialized sigma24 family protein
MKRKSRAPDLTDEHLDYLRWYNGGTEECPYYDEDAAGRVLHPGHTHEVSWSTLSESAEDNASVETIGEIAKHGNVPTPYDALAKYSSMDGMERLSQREREAFILKHACLMWPREIATFLDIDVQTVKTLLKRANKKLRRNDKETPC